MFALAPLSPTAEAVGFTVAVVLLLLAGTGVFDRVRDLGLDPVSLGLAVFVFVFAWNAWATT